MKYKHGLAVMRCQPLHIAHARLIQKMLDECEHVTVILGSLQEHGTIKNPFSYNDRKKMVKNVFKNNPRWNDLDVLGLADLNSEMEWADYVLGFVKDFYEDGIISLPDAYYCGSHYDGHWFRNTKMKIEMVDRTDQEFPYCSGTLVRDMCTYQDVRWKLYVHQENWEIVENLHNRLMWSRKQ